MNKCNRRLPTTDVDDKPGGTYRRTERLGGATNLTSQCRLATFVQPLTHTHMRATDPLGTRRVASTKSVQHIERGGFSVDGALCYGPFVDFAVARMAEGRNLASGAGPIHHDVRTAMQVY